jgi:ribonuclease VapC
LEAIDAYQTFGKGRHPAALNMGDCNSYATAKIAGAALLYKGNDFVLTDLPKLTPPA